MNKYYYYYTVTRIPKEFRNTHDISQVIQANFPNKSSITEKLVSYPELQQSSTHDDEHILHESTSKNSIMQQQRTRKHFMKHRQNSKQITDISMLCKEVKNPEGTFHFLRQHTHNSEDKSDYAQPEGQCRVK